MPSGGQIFLGGARYLSSGGAGIVADLPIKPGYVIEPGAEVRQTSFSNVSVYSSLNSGSTATVSLTGLAAFNDAFSASARVYYTRDYAQAAAYQTSSSYAEEFALVASFAPLLPNIPTQWSVSPYVKLLQTKFDAPNPYIDNVTQHDHELQAGLVIDTPLSAKISVVTNIQFARVESNIPNYRLHDFSVLTGPTVRF